MDYAQSFEKGMVQDFADQPGGTFYASNAFQLISKSGNTFALESPEGNRYVFSLSKGYIPIGACGTLDKIIVHSTKDDLSEIGIVTGLQQSVFTYNPIYNTDLAYSIEYPIECVIFPENEKVERIYWTDRKEVPRCLNILDARLYTEFAVGSVLPIGKYMVVLGVVNFNGVFYGPQNSQTVFEVTALTPNTYSVIGAAPFRVIEYIDKDILELTPSAILGGIRLNRPITGSAKNGSWIATFQLISEEGASTPWSVPCFPIIVAGPDSVGNTITNYQLHEGHLFTVDSTQGFELLIENIDQRYNRIRVAVVHGTDYQVYENPIVIFDGEVTGSTMIVPYTGVESIEELVEEDLAKYYKVIKKIGTLAIVNNILFPGNIEYLKNAKWDPSVGVTAKCIKYDCFHDQRGPDFNGHLVGHYPVLNPISPVGPVNTIRNNQWYRVKQGSITYEGNTYNQGDMFQGASLSLSATAETFTPIGIGKIEAVIRIKKYNDLLADKYQITPLENDFYDGKGMAVNHYLKSLWRGERYRYGLLLIDKAGNSDYVRWLTDKQVPEQFHRASDLDDLGNPIGFNMNLLPLDEYGLSKNPSDPNQRRVIRHIGVEINGIDFNELLSELGLVSFDDLKKYYSGCSIVRCPRDAKIIGQGMVFPTTRPGFAAPAGFSSYLSPMAARKMYWDDNAANQLRGYYTFYCPDFQMQWNDNPKFNDAVDVMALGVYDYQGPDNVVANPGSTWSNVDKNIAYYPVYGAYASGGSVKTFYKNNSLEQIEFGATGAVGASGFFFDNTAHSAGYIFGASGANHDARGCRASVINIDPVEPDNQVYEIARSVINIRNSKTNFYGGNAKSAKATNQYISTNHYQAFDDEFIQMLINTSGIYSGIEVYGGDANIGLYDVMRITRAIGLEEWNHAIVFPVESNCNFLMRNGVHVAKTGSDAIWEGNPEVHSLPHSFSNDYLIAPYTALPDRFDPIARYPYRGLFSLKKIAGEEIDGFRKFEPTAFRDVSGIGGAITNFRAQNMRLFYWQRRSVGYIPVNERQSISSAVGQPTVIGQGGVMERYDERTSYFGNQHQFGLIDTPDGFVWIDVERKVLCSMTTGLEIVPLDVAKGMNSFFQKRLTGNLFHYDAPTNGRGISGYYDPQMERVVISVMGTANDFTITYDQMNAAFTGIMPFKAGLYHVFQNMIFAMNPQILTRQLLTNTSYVIGNVVQQGEDVYACILDVFYVSGLLSTDPFHWAKIFSINDVFVQNEGDIAKWFGYVFPSDIRYSVLGEDLNTQKVFDNVEYRSTKEFFDVLEASTVDQNAVDFNIQQYDKNYQYRNKMWMGSLPLAADGRLVGNKLTLLLTKDNRLNGSPITSKNEKIVLNTAKTTYRVRY